MGRPTQPAASLKPAFAPAERRRIGYFTVMSGALLVFVLAGFSQTFYLRPLGELPPLSGPLHVHGAVLTVWFVLLFVQALLVRSKNVRVPLGFRLDLPTRAGNHLDADRDRCLACLYPPRLLMRSDLPLLS